MELNPQTIGDRPEGQQRLTTQRLDYDGQWITQVKVRESTAVVGAITPQEFVSGGIWTAHRDEPISDLLVNKITETRAVPGLYVPTTRYDVQLGPINGTRRIVENSGLITSLTATVKTTYDAHPNSKVVVYEMIETNSDGTGTSANPAYPIRVEDSYDNERGAIEKRTQIVAATGSEIGSISVGSTLQTLLINAAGSGYVVGEVITLAGGTIVAAAKVRVLTVSSGAIATFTIDERGSYTATSASLTQASTSGSGTGATFQSATYAIQARQIAFQPIDQFKLDRSIEMWTLPGPSLIRYDVDDESYNQVAITTQIIAKPLAADISVLNVAGTQVNYVPLNDYYGKKITMTIGATPSSRTETSLSSYTFPALVTGSTISSLKRKDKNAKFQVDLNHIGARSRVVPHTVAISYGTYANQATAAAILESGRIKLKTVDLNFQGVFFNVQASGVLTDSFTTTATSASDNPTWGVVIETYSVTASSPSASTYLAYGGTAQIISWSLKPWKYNLWRLESVSVVME